MHASSKLFFCPKKYLDSICGMIKILFKQIQQVIKNSSSSERLR